MTRSFCLLSLSLLACGGTQPAAEATPAPSPPTAAPKPVASAEAPPPEAEPEKQAAVESVEKPSRPPIDTITGPQITFQVNYGSSALSDAAEKKCRTALGDEPQAIALCKKKERGEFYADVLRFKKDASENVTWITYRRRGETLVVVHTTPVKLVDETVNSVTVQVVGKDTGPRVLFTHAKKFVVKVPNDYSIVLDDPRLGELIYDAKIGTLDK